MLKFWNEENLKNLEESRTFLWIKYEAETKEEVVSNFSETDEGETHAEAKETTGASNVRNPAHFLRLPEPFSVRLLKNIMFQSAKDIFN